ncbi:MAG: TlpA disulfide reductase family protein, partial [Chloroflexota bacterium]
VVRSGARPPAPTPPPTAAVGAIYQQIEREGASARRGALAPAFAWVTPKGELTDLESLRGRPVVINFWATWCVPCREEMPALDRVAAARDDVAFLAVNLQEDADSVLAFFERVGLRTLQPILDPEGRTARRYLVLSLPTTFFIDAQGTIRHIEIGGPMSADTIEQDLAKADGTS